MVPVPVPEKIGPGKNSGYCHTLPFDQSKSGIKHSAGVGALHLVVTSVIVNMDMIVEETNAASSSWYETSGNASCQDANRLRWERNTAISYRGRRWGKMGWERNGIQWI